MATTSVARQGGVPVGLRRERRADWHRYCSRPVSDGLRRGEGMRRRATTTGGWGRRGAAIVVAILLLPALVGCGRAADVEIVTGQLRAGDLDYWLVDTTLIALGGAQISGEKSQIGSTVRAEGKRLPDGVFEATRIMVGKADPSANSASLPAATASGTVEAANSATGRWQIAGRQVQLAPGVVAPGNVAAGDRATAKGYALSDGVLLAAEIVPDRPTLTATPPRPAPTPTATQSSPGAPGQPAGPPPKPTEKPGKTKGPRDSPGNGPGNGNNDDGD
jgi:hypothetical protein